MTFALAEQSQRMSARDRAQALWGIPPEIYGGGIPFQELPYVREVSNSPDIETAHHELQHIEAMQKLGEDRSILFVTVRREGNVLGAVVHAGVSPHNADAISAAGGIRTRIGEASGTGGDQMSVYRRALLRGDNPITAWNSALGKAGRIVSPPNEFKDKLASGLVVMGKASRADLLLLEKRVQYELQIEALIGKEKAADFFANGGVAPPYIVEPSESNQSINDDRNYPIPQNGSVILTEFLANGKIVDSEYTDGILICSKCKGTSYHDLDCPILVEAKKNENLMDESELGGNQNGDIAIVTVGTEMVTLFDTKQRKPYLHIVK